CIWFRELEHYGFIVLTEPGTSMRAARWRITDAGWGKLDGKGIEPTKDYLKWDGVLFERRNHDGSHIKSTRGRATTESTRCEEQKYSDGARNKSTRFTPSRGTKVLRRKHPPCEEQKYSDLGQPSPCAEGGECTGGAEPAPKPE